MADEPNVTATGPLSVSEQVLWKVDRSLAIIGIIAIAIVAIFFYKGNEGVQIVSAAIGGLVGYVGGRTGR